MKIRCLDGQEREAEDCLNDQDHECLPLPVRASLLHSRGERKRKKRDKPRFGMGRILGKCLRKSYYELVEEVVHPIERLWVFSRGHAIHEFFQKHLPGADQEVWVEHSFGLFDAIGFIDALYKEVLYEFKTVSNIPSSPHEHYVLQAQGYFSILSPEQQAKIKKIQIVYISLNKIKAFDVPKRDLKPMIEARGTILAQSLAKNELPSPESSWLCSYCDFKDLCDKNTQTLSAIKAKEIIKDSLDEERMQTQTTL